MLNKQIDSGPSEVPQMIPKLDLDLDQMIPIVDRKWSREVSIYYHNKNWTELQGTK